MKHRVAFEDAIVAFNDPNVFVAPTFREADGEDRFKAIGKIGARLYTVVYTQRLGLSRIISARRSNKKEEGDYGNRSLHARPQSP